MEYKSKRKDIAKIVFAMLLAVLIVTSFCVTVLGANVTRQGRVTTTGENKLNVRNEAGTVHSIVGSLSSGDIVTVLDEKTIENGEKWYYIEKGNVKGYAISSYIEIIPDETTGGETAGGETTAPGETTVPGEPTQPPTSVTDFEAYLNEQKFPESYKTELRKLHEKYPNWIFNAHHTGFDFESAVNEQTAGKSLVENTFPSSWKSLEPGAYDWETNQWIIIDGGRWVMASKEIIRHYMDPRNYLDESAVFQFLDQGFNSEVQNVDGVKRIIAGTFMEKDVTDTDGTVLNYAQAIYNAGMEFSMNPYVLASMIIIEVGTEGSRIVSGSVPGYEGYFNYLNIGAYNDGIRDAVTRGLWYAAGAGNGATSNLRPWNTRLKAIRGGAYFYSSGYLNVGQNTLYLKRFNVQGSNPFTHQYMTSVYGAVTEARKLAKGYTEELRQSPLVFYIPVYNNMPEAACPAPQGDGAPNNKLSSLSVTGYELTPDFNSDVLEYMLVVLPGVSKITINAAAMDIIAKVEGAGTFTVNTGNNVFEIKVTAGNGDVRTYKLTVAKESIENFGQLTFTKYYVPVGNIFHGIAPGTTVGKFRSLLVSEGLVTVRNQAGNEKADNDVMATGDTVIVSSSLGVKYGEYTASVKGDLNCDGKLTVGDLIKVRNIILGTEEINEPQRLSGDLNASETINISDLIKIRNHILGTALIS